MVPLYSVATCGGLMVELLRVFVRLDIGLFYCCGLMVFCFCGLWFVVCGLWSVVLWRLCFSGFYAVLLYYFGGY